MDYKDVILVNTNDEPVGSMEKLKAHETGALHRAFSIVLYKIDTNGDVDVLIQRRAKSKYHCGGQWSNTCCSHPLQDMSIEENLKKRLEFEMGIQNQTLTFADSFIYKESCKGGLIEHELDHVYVGEFIEADIHPNPDEVEDYSWAPLKTLIKDINYASHKYTPWLSYVMKITQNYIENNRSSFTN